MADRRGGAVRARSWLTGLLVVVSGAGCTPLDNVLGDLFSGRSMRTQPSIGAYENPMLPPENSVPFAAGNFPQAPGMVNTGQAELAEIPPRPEATWALTQPAEVMEMNNPVDATDASLARGEVMYQRACSPCHGATGVGDGPVTQVGMPAFSLLTEQAIGYPDGYIYTMIRMGRGAMPSYQHQITNYDRWHIVNYVRQLQAAVSDPPAGPADADAPTDADADTAADAEPDQAEEE